MPRVYQNRQQEFIDNLPREGTECIIWPFARTDRGYAHGNSGSVSKRVCEQFHGPAPTPEHEAGHSCDNGRGGCVAPYHLGWQTRIENVQDAVTRGTQVRGERHPSAIINEAEAREIMRLLDEGTLTQQEIAERFDVTRATVQNIKRGLAWTWLRSTHAIVNSVDPEDN